MKSGQYTAEQIIKILEQAARGDQTVGALCREHAIGAATFYHWRKTYAGMNVQEAQRLKARERANSRLKRLLAERMLEVDALKELRAKKVERGRTARGRALLDQLGAISLARVPTGTTPAGDLSLSGPTGTSGRGPCD